MAFKFLRHGPPGFDIKLGDNPFIIAHRGDSSEAPENTEPAFYRAVTAGAKIIELDVRLTKDRFLVVIHDRNVRRTTNGAGDVSNFTLAELQKLDAGFHFTIDGRTYPYRGKGVVIPTLDKVLTDFPEQNFLVELKDSSKTAAEELAATLAKHNAFDRVVVVVISIKHKIAVWLRKLDSRIRTGHTSREIVMFSALSRFRLGTLFRRRGLSFEVPRKRKYGWKVVTPAFVRQAKKQGVAVFVWTVNDPFEMRKWLDMGVDGLMTDSPTRMKKLLASRR